MISSFLTRNKWVNLGPDIIREINPSIRWKFGDQEGIYNHAVSRIHGACLRSANAMSLT